jgi:hypothetical protein
MCGRAFIGRVDEVALFDRQQNLASLCGTRALVRYQHLMIPPFDIFKKEKDGSLIWKGTAETLEVARLSVKVLVASSPGNYIIHSQQTGHKMIVRADGSTERIP